MQLFFNVNGKKIHKIKAFIPFYIDYIDHNWKTVVLLTLLYETKQNKNQPKNVCDMDADMVTIFLYSRIK